MKFIAEAVVVLLFAVVAVLVGGADNKAVAQALPQNQAQPAQAAQTQTVYAYVAQAGDSYSHMARKAVQTYGKKFNVALNPAQIMFAETHLTQHAGSPLLELGQKVELKESSVKEWVDKAKALSAADQAAWGDYAQLADFNTDAVGQTR